MKTKLVTFLYYDIHGFPFYGYESLARWYRFIYSLQQISTVNCPIVCYCGSNIHDKLETFIKQNEITNVTLKIKELETIKYIPEMLAIKEKYPDKFKRYYELGWAKIALMEAELEANLDYLYWIDCGLSHLGIFPERYNNHRHLINDDFENPYRFTFDGIFTEDLFDDINQWLGQKLLNLRNTQLWYNEQELNDTLNSKHAYRSMNVGGIIGGHTSLLVHFFKHFWRYADACLDKEVLLDHEAIMSTISHDHVDNYKTYIFDTWYHEDSYKTMPSVTYQYLKGKKKYYEFFEEIKSEEKKAREDVYFAKLKPQKQAAKKIKKPLLLSQKRATNHPKKPTMVTGLWDIKRGDLSESWARSFEYYLEKFNELLAIPYNLIVFGEEDLAEVVFSKRNQIDTQFIVRSQDWFKNEFYDKIQSIRTSEEWKNLATWLGESTQSRLEMYNPLVLSKVFLLHDAKILDRFDSSHLFWIDAGISNTVHPGYFTHDRVLDKLTAINEISFIAFPYKANNEIHGFEYKKLCEIANAQVDKVCRGGFFGGPKDKIGTFNSNYYHLLNHSLSQGYMGTEESIFSILIYLYPEHYQYYMIESNGLIGTFFENLKNDTHQALTTAKRKRPPNKLDINNTALYVITFNSPKQLQSLLKSMELYDEDFIQKPQWILLNNSTDESTNPEYERICTFYDIIHIKKDNLGICGGRQFIAEHAANQGYDYYFFFEDDMFLYPKRGDTCRNGFNRFTENLYQKSLEIIKANDFDFLKLSFSEFFGDNKTQWAWYNVPSHFRKQHWPDKPNLPISGLASDAPKTQFNHIRSTQGLAYTDGDIYYCNWPQIVSKTGNQKMFLEQKWQHPQEQTWMSYLYQQTVKGNLHPGLLLLSPIEHDRFEHYDKALRKES